MSRLSKIGAACLAAFGWTSGVSTVTASYLQVGGGGGGGYDIGGGGGAGGYLTGTTTLDPTLSYTVVVGAGGAGSLSGSTTGTSGSSSQFNTLTASLGGGGGGSRSSAKNGANGASGGGGSADGSTGGTGTSGQGFAGGSQSSGDQAAGGGGASAAGAGGGGVGTGTGNGGDGTASSITGSSVTYAGGGGGGSSPAQAPAGTGGAGGGGAGSSSSSGATPGTANLGGGGGGGSNQAAPGAYGANGGSGVVIISYLAPQRFGGGIVTTSGGNIIHTFTTSGTLVPAAPITASYLIVAGGGSGGNGNASIRVYGGGGAGGMLTGSGLTLDPNSSYLVTVGAGAASQTTANTYGNQGSNSTFSMVATAAVGGGAGAPSAQGGDGGSGGGGGMDGVVYSPGNGTSGQGNNGGTGTTTGGGGGGGAGAVGSNASGGTGGAGGVGLASSISGTSTYYAGGGGGGGASSNGAGGNGGGGSGSTAGTANTGGGGGGTATNITSGAGGSGVVIISYPGSTQLLAGGTVTISGGNVIHTFTSTGYLAPIKYANNSLRFRASASPYLNRTPTVAGNRKTFTYSGWLKRGTLNASYNTYFFSATPATSTRDAIYFGTGQALTILANDGSSALLVTSQVFRDPAAWYHIVVAVDTTQATAANRIKVYVNGVQVTAFSTATYPSQNYEWAINNTVRQTISDDAANAPTSLYHFDGYMTELNLIDGQALTPNSFGTFNSYGVWQPITYGGSYGTNGFYLPFTSNASSYAGYFNTGSQYLETTATQIIPATGDFTIEAMTYMTSFANYPEIAVQGTAGNAGRTQFGINTSGQLFIGAGAGGGPATGITMSLNRWYYVAVTRSGSTFNLYVNGILSGTITASVTVQNTTFRVGIDWGGDYTNGYISNLRVSNVVRTISPSTAPTSNFNNDASTVFLTLQGSTIVDNSSNAYAITNNGTVTVGQTYPFAYNVFNDKSPQGNNWTPNNISGITGSTLDYMTDVPTLTSATAANYCVLNPLATISGYTTTTNGNLTANFTNAGNGSTALATTAISSGKWYWEIYVTAAGTHATLPEIGIADIRYNYSAAAGATYLSGSPYGYVYQKNGNKANNGTSSTYGASWTTGNVIGVALDMDAGTLTFYKDNASQGTAYTGISGTFYPAADGYASSGTVSLDFNFGQQPWTYTPPSGFVALNTYNL
jgi:hypothetical protein